MVKKKGLIIDFNDLLNDSGVRYYNKEGNVTDLNDNIKQIKLSRELFNNRKYIITRLEKMNLDEIVKVLEFVKLKEYEKEQRSK